MSFTNINNEFFLESNIIKRYILLNYFLYMKQYHPLAKENMVHLTAALL